MPAPTRRIGLAMAATLLASSGAQAQAELARATAFVRAAGDDLTAAINDPALGPEPRRLRIAAILRRAVDIEGVGRFVLGRFWTVASPAEREEYLRLFDAWLTQNLAARFGEYRGVRIALGRTQSRTADDALVSTAIDRPGNPAFTLDWRVALVDGQPRVIDVIAEGTSLRLTQRSEYAAVITRNGGQVAPLLAALRQQVSQTAPG